MNKLGLELYSYEYIFLDGDGELRSKSMFDREYIEFSKLPVWNVDGSSVGLATTQQSEILLKPVRVRRDPFRRNAPFADAFLVLCETLTPDGRPTKTNFRSRAAEIFSNTDINNEWPWFGLEIEFVLKHANGTPIWSKDNSKYNVPIVQGQYYCGVGTENAFHARECVEAMVVNAANARIDVCGCNAEVAPGQWEIQIGILSGIKAVDDYYLMTYIMKRTAEQYHLMVDLTAKPYGPDWNGSGCHTNFSVRKMRAKGAKDAGVFDRIISLLAERYPELVKVCGADNQARMTGQHETAHLDTFTHGVGSRDTSLRIPTQVDKDGCGYMEFRVPNCKMDAYTVLSTLASLATLKD